MQTIKKISPFIILALLVCAFFFKILFLNKIILSGDLYYYYSVRSLISESLKSFHYPLWTPYLTGGFPLMANPEAGVFDPLNIILLYLFKPIFAFNMLIGVYFFIGGLFMFLFCRSLGLNRYASLFSAIVFIFGGAFAGRLVHAPMIFSASFMPFVFWMINLFFKTKKLRFIVLAGVGIGWSFLPGHPQVALYCAFAAILYFLFNCLNANATLKKEHLIRCAVTLAIILFFAAGISAIQNIPSKELTDLSIRAKLLKYGNASSINLNFKHFITYIFPYYFGWPQSAEGRLYYWGKGSFWELYVYIGILPFFLLFMLFGLLKKDKRVMFFSSLSLFSLLAALGKATPFYFLFFYFFPPLRYFKDPCRFIFISSFAMAILTGIILDHLSNDENLLKKLFRITTGAFLFLVPFAFIVNKNAYTFLPFVFLACFIFFIWCRGRNKIGRGLFNILVISVTLIDLFLVSYFQNLGQNSSVVTQPPPSVRFLKHDKSMFRAYHVGPDFPYGRKEHAEINKVPFFAVWGIPAANFAGPLYMSAFNYLFSDTNDVNSRKEIGTYLDNFSLLNVKYFTSTKELKSDKLKEVFDDSVVTVYENLQSVAPRAFFVNMPYSEASLSGLSLRPDSAGEGNGYSIKITKYQDIEICLDLKNSFDGFLVLGDTFYPGWKVFSDGKRGDIYRANHVMRAVFLKEGQHKIRFVYAPDSFKFGSSISLLTLALALFLCLSRLGEKKILP